LTKISGFKDERVSNLEQLTNLPGYRFVFTYFISCHAVVYSPELAVHLRGKKLKTVLQCNVVYYQSINHNQFICKSRLPVRQQSIELTRSLAIFKFDYRNPSCRILSLDF